MADVFVAVFAAAPAVYLIVRSPYIESEELLVRPVARLIGYGGLCLGVWCLLVLARSGTSRSPSRSPSLARRAARWGARTAAGAAVAVLALAAWSRLQLRARPFFWPPHVERSLANQLDSLTPKQRVEWAARVAVHRLGSPPRLPAGADARVEKRSIEKRSVESQTGLPLTVPASWSFPRDVEVAVDLRDNDTTRVWTRIAGGVMACASLPARRTKPLCDVGDGNDPALAYARPSRVADSVVETTLDSVGEPWPQYRHDALRTGQVPLTARRTGAASVPVPVPVSWQWQSDGEYRSSTSVIGDLGVIGTHGSGSIAALDMASGVPRWTARAPNWIHQGAVSDGRIVVFGFGDNTSSFRGQTPSGVTAYALSSGVHLWTRFDESSVMTSPVFQDDAIVYGSAAGVLRRRSARTGELLREASLPGGVIMGPPAAVGDTAVFTLDFDTVCAVSLSTLEQHWCRRLPGTLMAGHAAPAIAQGLVIASVLVNLGGMTLADFWRVPLANKARLLWSNVVLPTHWAGQKFVALDLHTGAVRWSSRVFGDRFTPEGHSSGTAAIDDSVGVIVLPNADSTVAFTVRDGRVRWAAGAHRARGPATIVRGHAIVSGRDGITVVRAIATGAVTCTMTRRIGYDRAGPSVGNGLLLFANLSGEIEALPVEALLGCDAAILRNVRPVATAAAHEAH